MHSYRRGALFCLVAGLSVAACNVQLEVPEGATVLCAESGACPSGLVCVEGARTCIAPGSSCVQRDGDAYRAAPDGNSCSVSGGPGICKRGACVAGSCGDGFIQAATEECDDGNGNDNDTCGSCKLNVWRPSIAFGSGPVGSALNRASFDALHVIAPTADGVLFAGYGSAHLPPIPPEGGAPPTERSTSGGIVGFSLEGDRSFDAGGAGATSLATVNTSFPARGLALGIVAGLTGDSRNSLYASAVSYSASDTELFGYTPFIVRINAGSASIVTGNAQRCDTSRGFACGDGGPARYGSLVQPGMLVFDGRGVLNFVDGLRVRSVTVDGQLQAIAGTGNPCSDNVCGDYGASAAASFVGPLAIATDARGRLLIADAGAHRIRVVADDRTIQPYAGSSAPCSTFPVCPSTTPFFAPVAMQLDGDALLVVDSHSVPAAVADPFATEFADRTFGDVVRRITTDNAGAVTSTSIVLGSGRYCNAQPCGDGGSAALADTGSIADIKRLADGRIAFIDNTDLTDESGRAIPARVRAFDLVHGTVDGVAGRTRSLPPITGELATSVPALSGPLARMENGDLAYADGNRIYRVDGASNTVALLAGAPSTCTSGCSASGSALDFAFGTITALRAKGGVLYVVDGGQNKVFAIADGQVTHVFGSGVTCATAVCADEADSRDVRLKTISAIDVDGARLIVSDSAGNALWQSMMPHGPAQRIAGDGARGVAAEHANATTSSLRCPTGVALQDDGSIAFADLDNCVVRRLADGEITALISQGACADVTVVDNLPCGAWADSTSGWAPDQLGYADGGLFITTLDVYRVFRFDGSTLAPYAGVADPGFETALEENANALDVGFPKAPFSIVGQPTPLTLAVTPGQPVTFAAARLRQYIARAIVDGRVQTIAGNIDGAPTGAYRVAQLQAPKQGAMLDSGSALFIDNGNVRRVDLVQKAVIAFSGAVGGYDRAIAGSARFVAPNPTLSGVTVASERTVYVAARDGTLDVFDRGADDNWTRRPLGRATTAAGANITIDAIAYADDSERGPTVYASATNQNLVYAIDPATLRAEAVVGIDGAVGFTQDGASSAEAVLDGPRGIAVSPSGRLYFAEAGNNRVRRLVRDSAGVATIETVVGTGESSSLGAGTPSRVFPVADPHGIAFDAYGNLLVSAGSVVRVVYADVANDDGEPNGASRVETLFDAAAERETRGGVIQCLDAIFPGGPGSIFALDACSNLALLLER